MNEEKSKQFNHLKIHTQYSICEGALKTTDLARYCKSNQVKAVGLCDSNNLCGALEFSENSNAPNKFDVSDRPIDLTLFFLQNSFKSSIFTAPSQIEY